MRGSPQFPFGLCLIIAACICVQLLVVVADAAVPCYCNNGNIDIATPQCVCACFSGYLMPHCLYTADDTVRMQLYTTINPSSFSADALGQEISWALAVDSSSNNNNAISFAWATPIPAYNWTVAYFDMKGTYAQQLLWDFYSNNSWLAAAQITSVWEDILTGAPMDVPLSKGILYRDGKGNVVSVDQLSWLFGAVCVVVFVSLLECCCLSNKEPEEAEEEGEEETPQATEDVQASRATVGGGFSNPLVATPQAKQQQRSVLPDGATPKPSTNTKPQKAVVMEATPSKQHQLQAEFCSRSRM